MLNFHLNPDLTDYKLSFNPNFFNTIEFQNNQQYSPLYSFYILDTEGKNIFGMIHFTIIGEAAVSQPKGPFGGFEFDPSIDEELFVEFNAFIEIELTNLGVKKIKLVERPEVLVNEVSFEPIETLKQLNYDIVVTDISHYINLEEVNGLAQIHSMERRNFRKALAKNYRWKLESEEALPEVYSFIERCRSQNNLNVNVTFEDLNRSFNEFPGRYRIFSIRHKGYLTAASITVEVSNNVLYNYLPASDKRFKRDSPMVFLMVSLYKYARSFGYQVLDLGVSSINGKIQTGLAEFKERMGAVICEKKTLEKKL